MTEDEIKRLKPGDKIRCVSEGVPFFSDGNEYVVTKTGGQTHPICAIDVDGDACWLGMAQCRYFEVVREESTAPDNYQRHEIAYRLCETSGLACICREANVAPRENSPQCETALHCADIAIALGARVEPKPDRVEELAREVYVSYEVALGTLTLWESLAPHVQDAWLAVARHAIAKLTSKEPTQ